MCRAGLVFMCVTVLNPDMKVTAINTTTCGSII